MSSRAITSGAAPRARVVRHRVRRIGEPRPRPVRSRCAASCPVHRGGRRADPGDRSVPLYLAGPAVSDQPTNGCRDRLQHAVGSVPAASRCLRRAMDQPQHPPDRALSGQCCDATWLGSRRAGALPGPRRGWVCRGGSWSDGPIVGGCRKGWGCQRLKTVLSLTLLAVLLSSTGVMAAGHFSDVPTDHTFHDEIAWLVSEGVTTGFDDGTFRPTVAVSRQAAAAFLQRYTTDTPPGPDPDPVPDPAPGGCQAPAIILERSGSMDTPGAVNAYSLDLQEGQRVSFENVSSDYGMSWRLVGPAPLGTIFDTGRTPASTTDQVVTFEQAGTYTLERYRGVHENRHLPLPHPRRHRRLRPPSRPAAAARRMGRAAATQDRTPSTPRTATARWPVPHATHLITSPRPRRRPVHAPVGAGPCHRHRGRHPGRAVHHHRPVDR